MLYRANFIKKAIMIRKENLHKVIWGILYLQKDFFEKGLGLNPLTMNDLAKYCGISQSSVSRLTSNKYLVFKDKIYKLKDFFPSLVPGQKKNVTPKKLKNILLWIIEKEDKTKPFSDKELVSKLEDEGINIKRRTVAKYRNELGIKGKFKRAVVNR